jgi:hypothetical protein
LQHGKTSIRFGGFDPYRKSRQGWRDWALPVRRAYFGDTCRHPIAR